MVASAIFILDLKGKIIISRRYRDDVGPDVSDRFVKYLSETDDADLVPMVHLDDITYAYVKHADLYLLSVTKKNANATMVLLLLYRIVKILQEYFKELNEESLRDNFVITYELLDEAVDFGYPQSTESTVLKQYITQESHKLLEDPRPKKPPLAVTGAVSWRAEGIKHKRNEVFLDVVERVNVLAAGNGTLLRSEVLGSLNLKAFLTGMPELKLGLNDRLRISTAARSGSRGRTVDLEDVKFHQCVQLTQFETDRTISFVPPDGECVLMSYRLNTQVKPLIWVEVVEPKQHSRTHRDLVIKAKSQFKQRSNASNVTITIPVPSDADSFEFKPAAGTAKYIPEKDAIVWTIKQFQGGYETLLRASYGLPSIREDSEADGKAPISISFEIPFFTVSGILVRYLKVHEKSGYDALCWVRYITKSGDYQLRRI